MVTHSLLVELSVHLSREKVWVQEKCGSEELGCGTHLGDRVGQARVPEL